MPEIRLSLDGNGFPRPEPVDRVPHPVSGSRLCLLLHDRFHGVNHRHCFHRSPDFVEELRSNHNTEVSEHQNRGAACHCAAPLSLRYTAIQSHNRWLSQMKLRNMLFYRRLIKHLWNAQRTRQVVQETLKRARELDGEHTGKHIVVRVHACRFPPHCFRFWMRTT